MPGQHVWRVLLSGGTYRAVVSTLVSSPHPVGSFEHLVAHHGRYPWESTVRTPVGVVRVWVPTQQDADEITLAFHARGYGSGTPQVVVDVGSRAGVSTAYFLSRSTTSRVHVWEPSASHLEVLERNVAPFADRCTIHPLGLAPASGEGREVEGIGDALRGVLRSEDHIDLLRIGVLETHDSLLDAIPDDVLPDVRDIAYRVPHGVRHLHPDGIDVEHHWRLAG